METLDKTLLDATLNGDVEAVTEALQKGASVNCRDKKGWTPLHMAAAGNNTTVIPELLVHVGANMNANTNNGQTPLHVAAWNNATDVSELFIHSSANLNATDDEGQTPLHVSTWNNATTISEKLILAEADVNVKDNQGLNPIHWEAGNNTTATLELLIQWNACVNTASNEGWTPLHWAAAYSKSASVLELLIHEGADTNARNNLGQTPVDTATQYNTHAVSETLKQLIAKHNAKKDEIQNVALAAAMDTDNIEITKSLLYKGADIYTTDSKKRTPLHIAAKHGDLEFVEWLIEKKIDVNAVDRYGWTPVHYACYRGQIKVLEHLIVHNTDIKARTNDRKTALHLAAEKNHADVVKDLISQGIDMEAKDNKGNTPLHVCLLAVYNLRSRLVVATTLVMKGADILAKNAEGETPYDIAKRNNLKGIVRMFQRELETGLPTEMRYMRVEDVDSFKHALSSGFYYSYLGKIMLVGNEGVGKTAITAIIIGRKPSKIRKSTKGIDVHISRAAVDLESRKLIPKDLSVEEVAYRNLIMHKRYGETSKELNVKDIIGDDEENDQTSSNDETESQTDTFETYQSDQSSDGNTDPATAEPKAAERDSSFLEKVLQKLGLGKKETITVDMLKEGTIKAGKKGMLMMNLAPVIILEFAGQRVLDLTHQLFLTHRGIYVLTVNGSLLLDDEMETESPIPGKHGKPTTRAYIEFWVSSILTYSKGRSKMFPKILVVCTHKDLVPVDGLNEQRSYIYGEITKMFQGTSAMDHLVLDHQIFVNAMNPNDPEVEILKDALVDIMVKQPSWGEKIPKSWIHLEMMINKKVENGEKVLHRQQLEEINRENPIQILSEKDLEVFLKVHHSQGDIIYFPLPGLRDHIIIYPAYLVDALESIVTDKRFCVGRRLCMVNTMNNDGILNKADLATIWQTNQKFKSHQGHLISVMSHLDILAEPRLYHQKTGELLSTDFFYVPSLMTKEDLTNFGKEDNLCKRSFGLSFTFHSTVLPSAVGFRFISCCVEMYDVHIYQNQRMLFSGMAVVDINKSLTMLVHLKKQRVDIFLIHATSRFQIIPDIASGIRECLNDTLYRISDSYKLSSAGPEVGTESVPFHIEYPCYHIESPCYTKQREGWICSGHGDDLGETMKNWFVNRTIEKCSNDCQGVAQGALDEPPSDLQLAKLVPEMGWNDFKPMLVHLGIEVNEINAIEEDYNSILTVMYVCLGKWRMKSSNGTLQDVYSAIDKSGSNVHALCKVFRDKPLDIPYDFQKQEPTDKDLDSIAKNVIRESLLLSVQLGIEASYWLQKKEDGEKIVMINRDMLRKWRDEHRGGRKMRELAQACSNVGVNIGFILPNCYQRKSATT